MARVLVAMSGGVDSSVAAAMLRDEGHDVTGVTLKLWGGPQDSGCCAVSDVEDARRVAAQLDIPHYVFNFAEEFERSVVDTYVDAHARGATPNPCVACNRTMKWGRLLERTRQLAYDHLATGHHARIVPTARGPRIGRSADTAKDQSYVLALLDAQQLTETLLPLGPLTKTEVRARAAQLGLRTAAKAESMDVCFITKHGRREFLDQRIPRAPGPIVTSDGLAVGAHDGVDRFTIGQRRGVGVAVGARRFVTAVDATTRTVTVGDREELMCDGVHLDDVVLLDEPAPDQPLLVQTSAHGAPIAGNFADGIVHFAARHPRVAPGQLVALYDGDIVIGGGIAGVTPAGV
jgi:tRNA-specific 2-thiouridylase